MSEENYPKWARPGGIKITDWTALTAFLISIFVLLSGFLAEKITPNIDLGVPETIQVQCSNYDFDEWTCPDNASFELVVDLFSIWNNSSFSTQTEVLENISGTARFMKSGKPVYSLPLVWKYFTDITDAGVKKRNTGRVPFAKGKIENLETQFVVKRDQVSTDDLVLWRYFVDQFLAAKVDTVRLTFNFTFAHSAGKKLTCLYTFDDRMFSGLSSRGMELHNFPRDAPCEFTP